MEFCQGAEHLSEQTPLMKRVMRSSPAGPLHKSKRPCVRCTFPSITYEAGCDRRTMLAAIYVQKNGAPQPRRTPRGWHVFCFHAVQIELIHAITTRQVTLRSLTTFSLIASRLETLGDFRPGNGIVAQALLPVSRRSASLHRPGERA